MMKRTEKALAFFGRSTMKQRTVEMAIAYSDGTWRAEYFVNIPFETPEEQVEEVARKELLGLIEAGMESITKKREGPEITGCFLYNSMDDEGFDEEEVDAVVVCRFCHKKVPAATAHLVQKGWVGDECCWDERLKSSE